jgi:hypothetical protein
MKDAEGSSHYLKKTTKIIGQNNQTLGQKSNSKLPENKKES